MVNWVNGLRLVLAIGISSACFWLVLLFTTYSVLGYFGQLPIHHEGTIQTPAEWLRFVPEAVAGVAFVLIASSVTTGSKLRITMLAKIISTVLAYALYRILLTWTVSTMLVNSAIPIPYIDLFGAQTVHVMQPSVMSTHCAEIVISVLFVVLLTKLTGRKQQQQTGG